MTEYHFQRECRTPYSEVYNITEDGEEVGQVDLHFTLSIVQATLCVGEKLTEPEIRQLIDVIDEELVTSAEVDRDDFVVTVYQGREVGVFSDHQGIEEEETSDW